MTFRELLQKLGVKQSDCIYKGQWDEKKNVYRAPELTRDLLQSHLGEPEQIFMTGNFTCHAFKVEEGLALVVASAVPDVSMPGDVRLKRGYVGLLDPVERFLGELLQA